MKIRSMVRDCLCLNWAVPCHQLPALPSPLRYQVLGSPAGDVGFVSALLFHHERVRLHALPLLRISYPQLNVRACVLDEDSIPSVVFLRMYLPAWVVLGARLFAGAPVTAAQLDFPHPSRDPGDESWQWRACRGARLVATARTASPAVGSGPELGTWQRTIEFFLDRRRVYSLGPDGPRRIETAHPPVEVWPTAVEVAEAGLVAGCLGIADEELPALHSSWICPEIPFAFDLGLLPRLAVPEGVPHPAASRAALCGRAADSRSAPWRGGLAR